MAMKQTQTKLFDFSDVGLDFCAGSKNLFPDRFKKMLALGYNEQTVSSVAVAGNQVTLSYGVSHGYVADRVLKVSAPELLSINGGEFVIDSVTKNTVTMTIDGAPTSIAGNFTSRVASLGWSLGYENANVQVYKFKCLDDSDVYARLIFQNNLDYRNDVSVCIGKSFNLATGVITDTNSLEENRSNTSPSVIAWQFSYNAQSSYNNNTYAQGFNNHGQAKVVGSLYHLILLVNTGSQLSPRFNSILPTETLDYESVKYPLLICDRAASVTGMGQNTGMTGTGIGFLGKIPVKFHGVTSQTILI